MSGDVGNAFPNTYTKEKIYSRAGIEFGERHGCVIEVIKVLYGLSTSARQWQLMLGDFIRKLGFRPTRAYHNVWYKIEQEKQTIAYISTYVDDFMIIGQDPSKYMDKFKTKFVIRNVEMDPTEYLVTQWSKT